LCSHMQTNGPDYKGHQIAYSGQCAKKSEVIRMVWLSRQLWRNGPEKWRVPWANSTAHGTRQARDVREEVGERMANKEGDDTGEKEMVQEDRAMTMTVIAGEPEMGATTFNDWDIQHNSTRSYKWIIGALETGVE